MRLGEHHGEREPLQRHRWRCVYPTWMVPRWCRGLPLVFWGMTALGSLHAQVPPSSTPVTAVLVLRGITVIDVREGRRLANQTVVLAGRHIRVLGQAGVVRLPTGARVVDARGKYLIPGLWDMHVHPVEHTDVAYPLFLANGVTGIRDAGSSVPLDTLLRWRHEIIAGTRLGPPRQLLSGPAIDESSSGGCRRADAKQIFGPQRVHICVARGDTLHGGRLIDSLQAAGADMVKMYALSGEMYFALARAARRLDMRFGGHVPQALDGRQVSDSGATLLDHYTQFMPNVCGEQGLNTPPTINVTECATAAQRLRRNGTWVIPTMMILPTRAGPRSWPALQRIAARASAFWGDAFGFDSAGVAVFLSQVHDALMQAHDSLSFLHIAHRVGLPLIAGTDMTMDTPLGRWLNAPGFGLHGELAMAVIEGWSPLGALQMATLNPALALRATDSLGTVEAGKLADLVVLDADPLVDIWNTTKIHAVVANGRYFDRAALDRILADARTRAEERWPR